MVWVLGGPGWSLSPIPIPAAHKLQPHLLLQPHRPWCWGNEAALPLLGLFFGRLTPVPASRSPPRGCWKQQVPGVGRCSPGRVALGQQRPSPTLRGRLSDFQWLPQKLRGSPHLAACIHTRWGEGVAGRTEGLRGFCEDAVAGAEPRRVEVACPLHPKEHPLHPSIASVPGRGRQEAVGSGCPWNHGSCAMCWHFPGRWLAWLCNTGSRNVGFREGERWRVRGF